MTPSAFDALDIRIKVPCSSSHWISSVTSTKFPRNQVGSKLFSTYTQENDVFIQVQLASCLFLMVPDYKYILIIHYLYTAVLVDIEDFSLALLPFSQRLSASS